jgi:hypothetical protein
MEKAYAISILTKQTKWLLVFTICILSLNLNAQTPQFEWVQNSTTLYRSFVNSTVVDQQGNIFYAGNFGGYVDFDPGPGTAIEMSPINSIQAMFVVKLDSNKNFLWVKTIVNDNYIYNTKMKIDTQGNLYFLCLASYYQSNEFYYENDTIPGSGYFILKTNNDGILISAKTLELTSGFVLPSIIDINIDTDDNLYLTGKYSGTVDFDFDSTQFNLSSNDPENFLMKINSNLELQWVKSIGSFVPNSFSVIALTSNGYSYVLNKFNGVTDLDPDTTTYLLNGTGHYIAKFDSIGNFIWANQYLDIEPASIHVTPSGDILCTGSFIGTVDFDPGAGIASKTSLGNSDIFIFKLLENGNFSWVKSFGGTLNDAGYCLTSDTDENIYFSGNFRSIVNFGNNLNPYILQSNGNEDIFLAKLDQQGNQSWVKSLGGVGNDYSYTLNNYNQSLFLGGAFNSTVDFNFGPDQMNLTPIVTNVSGELYLLKINQSLNLSNDTLTICQGDTLLLNSGYPAGNLWNTGDTTQYINVANNGVYYVSINNGTIVSDTITVIVIPLNPTPTSLILSATDTMVCSGSQTQITASLNLANNQTNYLWSVNGIITNTADSVLFFAVDSTLNITAYSNTPGVCNTPLIASTNSITVNTFPSTGVTFNSPQANTWLCASDPSFQITGGTPNGGTYSGSGVSNGLFTPNVSLPNINVVTYAYQDTNLCITQAIDTFFVDVCTAMSPLFENDNVQIFPTPAKDIINIHVTENSNLYFIIITDLTGNIVLSTTINNSKNEINITSLNCGIYFITIMQGDKQFISKFIKN